MATAVFCQGLEWLRTGLDIDSDVVALAQYGPALGALITWMIFRPRIREAMPGPIGSRQVQARTLLAVAVSLIFAVFLWIGYSLMSGHDFYGIQAINGVPFSIIALVWLLGATAEEVGWRGILQPALENPLPRWGASIVTGLLWSIWHVPAITAGPAGAALFIATTTLLAVLLAYLGDGSPIQRVITASVAHWLINLAILLVAGPRTGLAVLGPELIALSVTATLLFLMILWATLGPGGWVSGVIGALIGLAVAGGLLFSRRRASSRR